MSEELERLETAVREARMVAMADTSPERADALADAALALGAARERERLMPVVEAAWGIIANAGEGSWDRENPQWREAAERWRDKYLALLAPDAPEVPRDAR